MAKLSALALKARKAKRDNSEQFISGPGAYERIAFPGFTQIGVYIEPGVLVTFLKSESKSCACPCCQKIAVRKHDTCTRMIQDIFPRRYTSYLYTELYSFVCDNPQCARKVFREPVTFASRYGRRTNDLNVLLLGEITNASFRSTERMAPQSQFVVSRSTLIRMMMSINITHSEEPEEIGIDDVCGRKNGYYYTEIYDAKTHGPLDTLDGRDGSELKIWLQAHPNIKLINRDRASAYAKVSYEVYGDRCIQVADPFHVFDKLIEHLKKTLSGEEKGLLDSTWVEATVDGDEVNATLLTTPPKKMYSEVRVDADLVAHLPEYTCDPPRNSDGSLINYNFSTTTVTKKVAKERAKKRNATYKIACEVRKYRDEMEKNGRKVVIAEISRRFSISQPTVKKYLNMSENDVEDLLKPRRYAKSEPASPYIHMVHKMLRDGCSAYQIFCYIKARTDYSGTDEALATYINTQISNNFPGRKQLNLCAYREERYPENIYHISCNSIMKYALTANPKTKRDRIITAVFNQIAQICPTIKKIQKCMQDFYSAMHGDDPDAIDLFIKEYSDFIPGFCYGLTLDLEAVKNGIRTKTSSGYVEGNNTAFKLVKRTGCGRYKKPCLRQKSTLFLCRKYKNFDLYDIVTTRSLDVSMCCKDGIINY